MFKNYRVFVVLVVLVLSLVACQNSKNDNNNIEEEFVNDIDLTDFVQVTNGEFSVNNESFRFMGTNNYYMNYKDDEMIDDVIMNAKDMGVKVIRVWGFLDGMGDTMVNNNAYMQTGPGVFDQIPDGSRNGFEALDYTIKRAGEEGIYLVIALTNNWDAFGGVNQYVDWSETANEHDDFYTDDKAKEMYKDYVNYLLNRTNSISGIPYKEDSAIMTWELINEPRCDSDPSGDTIYNWAFEMSNYVKSIDPNHLVSLGDEGFFKREDSNWAYNGTSGVDWERNLTIDSIDYGTFHLYPDHWGDEFENPIKAGNKWIVEHAKAADIIGKPVVLEEYGVRRGIIHNRDYVYSEWLATAYEEGIDGTQFWILTGIDTGESADEQGMYPDYDGFRVVNGDNVTANLLKEHSGMMNGNIESLTDRTFILHPRNGEQISGIYAFKVDSLLESDLDVDYYTLNIEGLDNIIEIPSSGVLVLDTAEYNISDFVSIEVEAFLSNGESLKDKVIAEIDNKEKVEVELKRFSFNDNISGFDPEGTYMAEFAEDKLAYNPDFNSGALQVNAIISGDKEWQELRIVNRDVGNLADVIRIEFDVYYKKDLASGIGEFKPYAVANPGWVKLGVDLNNQPLETLEIVDMNNETYYKQHVSIPVSGIFDAPELYIGVVGGEISYNGPIYVDDIILVGETIVD